MGLSESADIPVCVSTDDRMRQHRVIKLRPRPASPKLRGWSGPATPRRRCLSSGGPLHQLSRFLLPVAASVSIQATFRSSCQQITPFFLHHLLFKLLPPQMETVLLSVVWWTQQAVKTLMDTVVQSSRVSRSRTESRVGWCSGEMAL